jgi:DNA-binding NtrC family response regulator
VVCARVYENMAYETAKFDEINVLASQADWAWPMALRDIFQPRGVNLLVAQGTNDFVQIIQQKRIHTTIVDMDSEKSSGMATVRIIRMEYPMLPCIMLASCTCESILNKALQLDVFSVIDKPVDLNVLREQLNRLFMKRYNCDIFK